MLTGFERGHPEGFVEKKLKLSVPVCLIKEQRREKFETRSSGRGDEMAGSLCLLGESRVCVRVRVRV